MFSDVIADGNNGNGVAAVTSPNSANVEFAIKSTVIGALVAAVAAASAATRTAVVVELWLAVRWGIVLVMFFDIRNL